MGQVSAQEKPTLTIEEKIRNTFPEDPESAIQVFTCESGLRATAFNGANTNGTWDAGIAQINSIHGYDKESLFDEDFNLEVARKIYDRAGSWQPWVCARKLGIIK